MSEEQTTSNVDTEAQEQSQATPAETGEQTAEKPNVDMIPKARLDAEIAKRKELEQKAREWEEFQQKQADEEAAKRGEIEKFQRERDEFKTQAERWKEYANGRLERLTADLDDDQKAMLAVIEDGPLDKRLELAERLASAKKPEPGFGSNGGKTPTDVGGLIPPTVQSMGDYHTWMANLANEPEGRALLKDHKKMNEVREEARRKFT